MSVPKANSVREFQDFATTMMRFHHEMKRQLDNAYVVCCESDPETPCIGCPFYSKSTDHCKMYMFFDLLGE